MLTTFLSDGAPGRVNEDYVVTGPHWGVVLDGATPGPGVESGCMHDVPWLVRSLAGHLAEKLVLDPRLPLRDGLEAAISATCRSHESTCDLANPDSPSAAIVIARKRGDVVDHLVLADSQIIYRSGSGYDRVVMVTDDRPGRLPSYTPESVRKYRNSREGFWVASTSPEAAWQAVTGSHAMRDLSTVYLMTDGVARYVDLLNLGGWSDLTQSIDRDGPVRVLRVIRQAERERLPEISLQNNGRRLKRHDDATLAIVKWA
jgi:Protein phosphatase 2C